MSKNKVITIPNILSVFRILLAVMFLYISIKYGIEERRYQLLCILIVSGATDFFDGLIARKFDMISELGKVIDPFADKLTQGVLLISFLKQYKVAKYVLILFAVKEIYMSIMGLKTVLLTGENDGAMWYGKVSTAFFYAVMTVLFLFPQISDGVAEAMVALCGFFMLMALILYDRHYKTLQSNSKNRKNQIV